jgi:hypothetical protein
LGPVLVTAHFRASFAGPDKGPKFTRVDIADMQIVVHDIIAGSIAQ